MSCTVHQNPLTPPPTTLRVLELEMALCWCNADVRAIMTSLLIRPLVSANHVEQAMSLARRLPEQLPNLILNVPPSFRNDSASMAMVTPAYSLLAVCAMEYCPQYPLCNASTEIPDLACLTRPYDPTPNPAHHSTFDGANSYYGGLPWISHNLWSIYRHTMDESVLRGLFPLLSRATNFYVRTSIRGGDGKLHLPPTFSPEYAFVPDCSFDLALFKWCLTTSIHIAQDLLPGSAPESTVARWRQALSELAPPQVDPATGSLMIGEGEALHSGLKMWSKWMHPSYVPRGTFFLYSRVWHM